MCVSQLHYWGGWCVSCSYEECYEDIIPKLEFWLTSPALNISNTQYLRYLRSDHVDNYTNLTSDHHNLSMFGDPFLSIPDPFIKQYYCCYIYSLTKEQAASAAGQIRSRCWLHHITHYQCCCCWGAAPGFEWRPAACIAHSMPNYEHLCSCWSWPTPFS